MERADVVVIGAGVMGTSIACHLRALALPAPPWRGLAVEPRIPRAALRVLVVEKDAVCSGTSGKSSAIVRTHYSTRPTAAMALLARRMFERFEAEVGGPSGFVRTGMLFVGNPAERESVEATVRMNRELGIDTDLVDGDEMRRIDPLLSPAPGAPIVWEPGSGYASPHDLASSFARRFGELGGTLWQGTEVTAIDTTGGRVRGVSTTRGDVRADHVVIAAGPWASGVGRLAGLPLPVMASRQSIVTLRPRFEYGPGHPVVADLVNDVYFRPETGRLILLGNTRHGDDRPGDPDRYEDRPEPALVEDLVGRLARVMPAAADAEIAGGWSGMYEISPDWNPMMGSVPGVAGLHYCVGFSGHGFKLSPAAGLLMAEHILDGRATTLDITPYRLERFAEGRELRIAYTRAGVIA